ncbi:hypothetical protein HS125_20915 [bacterium]|nr:hypothetical protein [bacterium]
MKRSQGGGSGGYAPEALGFIVEALHAVVNALPEPRHISGAELLAGVCRLARERFDFLAPLVLRRWRLERPQDVGRAVFVLVRMGVLKRRPQDSPADFDLPGSLCEEILAHLDHLSELRGELANLAPQGEEWRPQAEGQVAE